MKISEFIKKLEEIKTKSGDLEVYVDDWSEGYAGAILLSQYDIYKDHLILQRDGHSF